MMIFFYLFLFPLFEDLRLFPGFGTPSVSGPGGRDGGGSGDVGSAAILFWLDGVGGGRNWRKNYIVNFQLSNIQVVLCKIF